MHTMTRSQVRGLGRLAARTAPDGDAGDDARPGLAAAIAAHGEGVRALAHEFIDAFWTERLESLDGPLCMHCGLVITPAGRCPQCR